MELIYITHVKVKSCLVKFQIKNADASVFCVTFCCTLLIKNWVSLVFCALDLFAWLKTSVKSVISSLHLLRMLHLLAAGGAQFVPPYNKLIY